MSSLLDSLSEIGPQIMAGFGKRPETIGRVLGIQDRAAAIANEQNLRAFGDELFTGGGPMTAEKVMAAAQKHKVDPRSALLMTQNVMGIQGIGKEQPQDFSRILPNGQVNEFQALLSEVKNRFGDDQNVMPGKITGSRTPDPKILTGDGAFGVFNRDSNTIDPLGGLKPVPGAGGPASVNINLATGKDGQQMMPLQKAALNKIQGELMDSYAQINRLDDIEQMAKPEFFQWWGKAKDSYRSAQEKLGFKLSDEEVAATDAFAEFTSAMETNFNLYRKNITGAAASIQELDRLKKAMFNTDQSYSQFKASFRQYKKTAMQLMRLQQKVLRSGIAIGSENFGSRIDTLYGAGDKGNSEADADARYYELVNLGKTPKEALQRLVFEGYVERKKK